MQKAIDLKGHFRTPFKANIRRILFGFSGLFCLTGVIVAMRNLSPYMCAATIAYGLMLSGFAMRKRSKTWHSRLMLSAIGLDLLLVLILELQRSVINTAFGPTLNGFQIAHVGFSSAATALYFPMLYLGFKLYKNSEAQTRHWHMRIGIATFIFRTLGFILMFSLIGRPSP